MKISLLYVNKSKEKFISDALAFYVQRIKKYIRFEVKEISINQSLGSNPIEIIKKECSLLQNALKANEYVILLDEKGHQFSSEKFATYIQHLFNTESRNIVFVIGGAYGFTDEFKKRANSIISLSSMTFPHQLARVIFSEQLYRALSIIKNEPYHHT